MNCPSKEDYQALTAKQAALWAFNTDPDQANPFDKSDSRYHEFNNELFNLECGK